MQKVVLVLLLVSNFLSSKGIGGSRLCHSQFVNKRSQKIRSILQFRGGKADEKPQVILEDEDLLIDDSLDSDGTGVGSQGRQLFASIKDMWDKTPPMTQVYVGSSIFITLFAYLFNGNKWPKILNLDWGSVFTGQLWRPFTSFLFFGPFGLNYILTIHFVWTYMGQLEKLNYNKPEDFFILLGFGATTLLVGYTLLGLSPKFLGHNLSTYLVYIWARTFEGTDVNVMDLFLLRAEVLPWFFCLQTLVLEGEMPFADFLGIVVGHLYHYLSQRKFLVAPEAVKQLFSSEELKKRYKKFKDEFE